MRPFIASLIVGLLLVSAICSGQTSDPNNTAKDQFAQTIRPLLNRYCLECHAADGKESEFLFPESESQAVALRNSFACVLQQLENGTMPPADFKQPTESERKQVKDWINRTFDVMPSDFDRLSTYVVETFEDTSGNLWFGTLVDGAARYDGKTLTWFSKKNGLGGDTVPSIAEDRQGNLWFGTEGGVTKYDGHQFMTYSKEAGLPGTRCYVLADREGQIWVGTERGVFRFTDSKFSPFDIPAPQLDGRTWKVNFGKVWCLIQDRLGNIWIARDGQGLCRFDGQTFTHFTKKDGLCSNNISSVVEDRQGNIWIGCLSSDQPDFVAEGGLNRYDGPSIVKYPETKGLTETDIYTIYATKSGDVWIGATGLGAYRYDGKTFTLFDTTDRPYWTRYFGLQSMVEDRQGRLWFGFSGGLFQFNGTTFTNVGKADLSGDSTTSKPSTGSQTIKN